MVVKLALLLSLAVLASSESDCSQCNHKLTAPLYQGCSDESAYLTYNDVKINCGQALPLSTTESTPTFHYPNAEDDALYSLLMIDTTGIDPVVGTQPPYLAFPYLHYGAMNIPGDALKDGISLDVFHKDDSGVRVVPFVSYQKPFIQEQLSKVITPGEETPPLETRAFNYEFMLGKQKYERDDPVLRGFPDPLANYEFIGFMKLNVDTTNIVSTYFTTGVCVKDIPPEDAGYGSDCPVPAETLSGYGNIPDFVADALAPGQGAISNENAVGGIVLGQNGKGGGDTSVNGGDSGSSATTEGSESSTSRASLKQISAVLVSLAGLMFGLVGM